MTSSCRTVAVASCLLIAIAPSHGNAENEAPADLLARAQRHFELQEYDLAEAALKDAYRLEPRPAIMYALGQAQRLGGACDRAIVSYRTFLRQEHTVEEGALAEQNITRCEAVLAARPPPVDKPPPVVTALPEERELGSQGWTSSIPGHVLTGTGIVAAAAGTVLGVRSYVRRRRVEDAATLEEFLEASGDAGTVRRDAILGTTLAIAGAASVAAGIWFYLRANKRVEAPPVAVSLDAHGTVWFTWSP